MWVAGSSLVQPDADLLLRRTRAGLWLVLVCIAFFALVDAGIPADRFVPAYGLKAAHGALTVALLALLRGRPTARVVWWVALLTVNATYGLFAMGDVIKGHEATAPLLGLTCSMTAAALLPWGLGAQVVTALVTSLGNVVVQRWTGATWSALLDPAASMLAAQGVAVYVVFELERFRHERRRVEAELAGRARTESLRAEVRVALSEPLPSPERWARCAQALGAQLEVPVAAIFTTDGEPPLRLRAVHGLPAQLHASFARFADELFTREARDPEWAARHGFRCVTRHPLVGGGQTIGFLVLMAPTRLADDVLATVRAVADTLAGGLVHARTEEAKAQLLAQLERANRVKSEFVSTMSHELRTPLNVIMGYADMLGDPGCPDPAFALGRIRQANHELLGLIEATLDLNRLEAGRDEPTYDDVSFDDLWLELAAEFAPAAARAGLRLDWTAEPALTVRTDRRKLRTIVKNLVGNALKFTPQGRVRVLAGRHDGHCLVRVEDSGVGIPADALPHVFDMFRQVDSSDRRSYGGVGLGLHIVQRLSVQLGAEVTVTSAIGRGTTFTLRLPRAPRVVCAA